jgi:hypothetical protein
MSTVACYWSDEESVVILKNLKSVARPKPA